MSNEGKSSEVQAPAAAMPGQVAPVAADQPAAAAPAAPFSEPGAVDDPQAVNRTGFAQAGAVLVALFAQNFKDREVPGLVPRRVKLSDPGVSTDGGAKARQSIILYHAADESRALVVGWLDPVHSTAELRTFETVASQYKTRFRLDFDIKRADYDALRTDLQKFLESRRVKPNLVHEPGPEVETGTSSRWTAVAIVAAAVVVTILVGIVIVRHLG